MHNDLENALSRTEIKMLQIFLLVFRTFLTPNNECVSLKHGKDLLHVLKKQQKKKRRKKAKHQRAQIATVAQAVQIALQTVNKNYLIHTNCMYSLVVNFDKEESSKWERTKIEVTMRTNII